jgi:antitoxin HicB
MATIKDINYYLNLPYTVEVIRDNDPDNPGWVARVVELPGCITQADSFEELEEMLNDAMRLWIEVALEDGVEVPEPRPVEDYSGKFVARVPKSLHRKLVETAEREGVSLNQYLNVALAESVGERHRQENVPIDDESSVSWPGLKIGVKRVLQMAGYDNEVATLDERLFAEWSNRRLANVARLSQQGLSRQALAELNELILILRSNADRSPVIALFSHTLALLHQVIEASSTPDANIILQISQMLAQTNVMGSRLNVSYSNESASREAAQFQSMVEMSVRETPETDYLNPKQTTPEKW